MVKLRVKIYVEGGGEGRPLKMECRKGLRLFFEKAGLQGAMPAIVACGSRGNAYQDFCTALRTAAKDECPLLLVDSEASITGSSPWQHLKNRPGDSWDRPARASDDHAHLMVQCMESWFLADRAALAKFFGSKFSTNALPVASQIEDVAKQKVYDGLKAAIKPTKSGSYQKGKHSFKLLAEISPAQVQKASPWAKRLIDFLRTPKIKS